MRQVLPWEGNSRIFSHKSTAFLGTRNFIAIFKTAQTFFFFLNQMIPLNIFPRCTLKIHFEARFAKLQKKKGLLAASCLSICLFLRMEQLGYRRTDFQEIWYLRIFRKSVEKIQVSTKPDKNNGYFTWRPIDFLIISRWILLRMRNVSDRVLDKIETHILCSITFFEDRVFYGIMWVSLVEPDRPQMTTRHMRITCWISKATHTHTQVV